MNIFDHSHALLGYVPSGGEARLTAATGRLGLTGGPITGPNRHFLLDTVDSDAYFTGWIAKIASLPDFAIEGVCEDAKPFGMTPTESLAVQNFLKIRRDRFLDLIKDHRAEFTAITTWSLV